MSKLSYKLHVCLFHCRWIPTEESCHVAGPRSLVDRSVESYFIRFLTAVVRASLRSHVEKASSDYGWSGGFSTGSPIFDHL